MKSDFANAREFVRGVASRGDRCFFLSKGKALLDADIAHTSLIGNSGGVWTSCVDTAWSSTAIAVARKPAAKLLMVGENGDVVTYLGGGKSVDERIKPAPKMIRNAKTIDGFVYACGMQRQVYFRSDEKKWTDISAPPPNAGEAVGFEAIDGFSGEEIFAVGWNGEIWTFDGDHWVQQKSPAKVILSAVCCAPDSFVYAAGQQGVLLRGRNGAWDTIFDEGAGADIWDLCWFGDKLYIATISALYRLHDGVLAAVDFGDVDASSCYSLSAADGVLWSTGQSDVLSFDGKRWRKYE